MSRIKPRAAGWEASMLPVCYADPHPAPERESYSLDLTVENTPSCRENTFFDGLVEARSVRQFFILSVLIETSLPPRCATRPLQWFSPYKWKFTPLRDLIRVSSLMQESSKANKKRKIQPYVGIQTHNRLITRLAFSHFVATKSTKWRNLTKAIKLIILPELL